ncbi:hypothetical protein HK405_013230, partial [Cladochytrium tenue]
PPAVPAAPAVPDAPAGNAAPAPGSPRGNRGGRGGQPPPARMRKPMKVEGRDRYMNLRIRHRDRGLKRKLSFGENEH